MNSYKIRNEDKQGVRTSRKSPTLELDPIGNKVFSVTLLPLRLAIPYPFVSTFHVPDWLSLWTTAIPTPPGEFQSERIWSMKVSIPLFRTLFGVCCANRIRKKTMEPQTKYSGSSRRNDESHIIESFWIWCDEIIHMDDLYTLVGAVSKFLGPMSSPTNHVVYCALHTIRIVNTNWTVWTWWRFLFCLACQNSVKCDW